MMNFNPRTREGCDAGDLPLMAKAFGISIHAPVKGATSGRRRLCAKPWDFNPRTREGCDLQRTNIRVSYNVISIHAPVKGATLS